jgi:predicted secreted Zn-dependent protease
MQLARQWREHLAAGFPHELSGVEIAGSDARALDAEISACVSALLCRSLTVDGRIERRLSEISTALSDKQAQSEAPVAAYCARLNQLVSAVLTESRADRPQ